VHIIKFGQHLIFGTKNQAKFGIGMIFIILNIAILFSIVTVPNFMAGFANKVGWFWVVLQKKWVVSFSFHLLVCTM